LYVDYHVHVGFAWITLFRNLETIMYDQHGYHDNCLMLLSSGHNWFTVPRLVGYQNIIAYMALSNEYTIRQYHVW